jgi:hypothetical protein
MIRPMELPSSASEDEFHLAVAGLLELILIPPTFFTTFPSGYGKLGKATAGRLRTKGLKPGMPDILVFGENRNTIGLELKAGRNGLQASQRTMHAKLQACGHRVYVARTIDEVLIALRSAHIRHREVSTWQTTKENGLQLDLPMERSDAVR